MSDVTLIRSLESIPSTLRGGAVAIGNFDGVHRGHARLVQRLGAQATSVGGPAIIFTFDPHPVVLLRPEAAPHPLTWSERKAELLGELGVDAVIAYPTDMPLLGLSPHRFFERIIVQGLSARAIVEGPNFRFGHNREGDVTLLEQFCSADGLALEIVPAVIDGDAYISSSRIRDCIRDGDVDGAREMLTQPYRVRGMITHGARRGGTIGFPTANLEAVDTLLPGMGVYAGRALCNERSWPAAINIGPNPTFDEHAVKFETHLIGFRGSLYGQPLEVDFLSRLRDIHPFGSVDELKRQLDADVQSAGELVTRWERNSQL
jgi:riboflavin kinase/FMN adenylyltransferase